MDGGRKPRERKEGLHTAEGDCTHDPPPGKKIDGDRSENANADLGKIKELVQKKKGGKLVGKKNLQQNIKLATRMLSSAHFIVQSRRLRVEQDGSKERKRARHRSEVRSRCPAAGRHAVINEAAAKTINSSHGDTGHMEVRPSLTT